MKPTVSICCLCYNHEKYLPQALDSFLSQKGEFDLQIVLFDDCSTDSSRKIIEEYKNEYPDVIKLIYPDENIYSQNKTAYFNIINETDGEYLAFCEGDDYWIDNSKIQQQLDYLLNKPMVNLVFHPSLTLCNNEILDNGYGYYGLEEELHAFESVLAVSGSYMPMASIFARKSSYDAWFKRYPEFFSENTWHSIIQFIGTYKSKAGYLPNKMSVYRSMHTGSWSSMISLSSEAVSKDFKEFMKRNRKLNEITKFEFQDVLNQVLISRSIQLSKIEV